MPFQALPVEQSAPWLAITSGCCASRRDSIEDEGRVMLRSNGTTEMQICYDQPRIVPQLRAEPVHTRPTTSHSVSHQVSQWVANSKEFANRASSRASMHTLSRPRKSMSKSRPSIGLPTDFRHYGGVDGIQSMVDEAHMPVRRRRSFRPLELSIYSPDGRLSPLPDFSVAEMNELQKPAQALVRDRDSTGSNSSYLIQRKPVGTGSRRSSVQSQSSLQSRPISAALSTLPFLHEEPKSRPESYIGSPPTLQRSSTQSSLTSPRRILSRLPSPSRSRSNTAPARPGSLRRAKTDVDEAIRELNTIVEERRASAYRSTNQSPAFISRPPPSPSHHVPAIAPSLRMRVRSETLSDIGSAFSAPLTGKSLPSTPLPTPRTKLHLSVPARSCTGPLSSNPITPPTPTVPTPTTPIHRLASWLKRSKPNTPTTPSFSFLRSIPSTPKSSNTLTTPFYQCEPPLPQSSRPSTSRPSTSTEGSRTLAHTRQTSNETATVTLFSSSSKTSLDHKSNFHIHSSSSIPSTPALSTRSISPEPMASPPTPARGNLLRGQGKVRRVPAPLTLSKEKESSVEKGLGSARSSKSVGSKKPPPSPHYGLLRGMEICGKEVGLRVSMGESPVSPVGIAF